MEQYKNLLVYLISTGTGEEPESILEEYRQNGFVELEQLDFVQIISLLEAILDISTDWLKHTEYKIDLDEISNYISQIKN